MARGLSQAIAAITRASDKAGSAARSRRRQSPPLAFADRTAATALMSAGVRERGVDHLFFIEFVTREFGGNGAVTKYVGAVAVLQLVDLGRIPEEGAALLCFGADQVIDFKLGVEIDAAHRIVHQHDACVGAKRPREKRLLLIAARERENVVVDVRRADLDALAPGVGEFFFKASRKQRARAQLFQRAHADVM